MSPHHVKLVCNILNPTAGCKCNYTYMATSCPPAMEKEREQAKSQNNTTFYKEENPNTNLAATFYRQFIPSSCWFNTEVRMWLSPKAEKMEFDFFFFCRLLSLFVYITFTSPFNTNYERKTVGIQDNHHFDFKTTTNDFAIQEIKLLIQNPSSTELVTMRYISKPKVQSQFDSINSKTQRECLKLLPWCINCKQ